MSSLLSLADESPTKTDGKGESPNGNNAAIPGEEPAGFDGEHGESPGLADLLAESEETTPDGESQDTPAKLLDLAEKLGKKPEDLYALTVAFDDGKTMTIGELKDLGKKATDFEAANLDLETRRQEQDAKFTRMHGELRELVAALPEAARSRDAFAKAAQKYQARLDEARKAADGAIEEWQDPAVRKDEQAAISRFLEDYGFETGYLEQVLDPRTIRFLRDSWKLHKRVTEVMAKVRKSKPSKKPTSTGPSKPSSSSSSRTETTPVSKQYSKLLD